MPSRSVTDLHPELQKTYWRFCEAAKAAGLDFVLTCTYRSSIEQNRLYAQGRTRAGKKVTNARGGQSKHNAVNIAGLPASRAFDVMLMVNGKPDFAGGNIGWAKLGAIGQKLGLVWGGAWKKFRDLPHFQMAEK